MERPELQFVSDASHELKTPLACLRSLVEALESGGLQDPKAGARFLELMHKELDRMDHLVGDLLKLHKLERGIRLRPQELELAGYLTEVGQEYAPRLAPVELALDVGKAGRVRADPHRLRQVLGNLLENARRASAGGSQGRVSLVGTGAEIRVEDQGVGLDAEHLERVFDRFFKVDQSRSRELEAGGTGLGLAITRGLVEAMGGKIRAESPGLGLGATFVVTLPKAG